MPRGRNPSRQPSEGNVTSVIAETSRRRSSSEVSDRTPKRRRMDDTTSETSGRRTNITDENFLENMAALRPTAKKREASQLKPESVDLHVSTNRPSHHTEDYNMDGLIVRRGQEFKLTVTFDRPFDPKQDKLIVQLAFGSRPQESKNSLIRVKESNQLVTSSWGMRIDGSHDNDIDLSIMSPCDAMVGEYSVYIETKTKKSESEDEFLTFRKKMDKTLIVLFNAWCKDDVVYMQSEEDRREYVLNDRGRIWVGNKKNFGGIPWYFGQFEDVSLSTCLHVLGKSLKSIAHGNATSVCRALSQMVNFNDQDGGILEGRWTETYPEDSTAPTKWTGSVAILKEFSKRHKTVRYGQCWVFSGLTTTLLRAIGIPTRSVTNFESAHDTDASMTIDFHFNKKGEPLDDLNDSIWNFHVWNESYFARPDLPAGYGGWQAHDATPQETSEDLFRCGPCPVKAIKEGEVYIPYDGGFIFGEVNGDRVYWEVDDDGEMRADYIDKHSIGKFISTKAVGSNDRHDLTLDYKYPEGSQKERAAARFANKFSSRKHENIYSNLSPGDVTFNDNIENEKRAFGDDVQIKLLIKNTSDETRSVKVSIVTKMAFYTGVVARDLESLHENVILNGKEEKNITLSISADQYINKTAADTCIKVFYKAKVQETGQVFSDIDTVEFNKPDVMYRMDDSVSVDKNFKIKLSVKNHLPVKLTNCVFNIESSRFLSPDTLTLHVRRPVKPNEAAVVTASFKASTPGTRYIDVTFSSDQLTGVRGEIEFEVKS